MSGTNVGDALLAVSRPSAWGGPCFSPVDDSSGGVAPGEAQFLYGLVRALRPAVVLEVGTSYGWSGLHLADGLRANGQGRLHTVEVNAERQAAARANFDIHDLSEWVEFHHTIPALERVDLAFLDALHTTEDVRAYLAALPPRVGLVAIHDALWQGHVERAIEGTFWKALYLPGTSEMGLALLQWGAP